MLDIVTILNDNISSERFSGLVTIDLSKAFDTVCHKRLLIKLDHYGITGTAYNLINSYLLTKRSQYVFINYVASVQRTIKMGVLQGSILDPLLFLIYINDLHNCTHSVPRLFTDDTAILVGAISLLQLERSINQDLNRLSTWMVKNKLIVNPSKSQAIIIAPKLKINSNLTINIQLNSCLIFISDSLNYFSLIIDSKLLFDGHINMPTTKLSQAIGIMSKLKFILPINIIKQLYFAFFRLFWCMV